MSRRRTENRGQKRKHREAERRRAWERIYDVPSVRQNGTHPVFATDPTEPGPIDEADR